MPSDDYEKVIELLRLLVFRSRAGQVKWETYPDEEMVRTDVGSRTVRIGKETGSFRGDDGSRFENQPCFVVWVMDEYGRSLDEVAIEALGLQPRVVLGSASNIKITYPGDLDLAAAVLFAQDERQETC